ncbi:peptidase M24 [Fusarium oxysporum f. sp. albedinis]|nr:peptidase M24 [Fusarium oxysporum f. sp. albedinis]
MSDTRVVSADQDKTLRLLDAQNKALVLFNDIERDLLRKGVSEKQLSDEIHHLGNVRYGIKTHWHKRVVRSGPNTLKPYSESLTDRIIEDDDILFVDLGPLFETWEADFGRTYVLGNDPIKLKLRDDLHIIWRRVKEAFWENSKMTGDELYTIASREAKQAGYVFGAEIAGHLVGSFPHERIPRDKVSLYVMPGNTERMTQKGKDGLQRHWILEIHLHDYKRGFGGFMEQLLTINEEGVPVSEHFASRKGVTVVCMAALTRTQLTCSLMLVALLIWASISFSH